MNPEAEHSLGMARRILQRCLALKEAGYPEVVARDCYLVAFHAANAYIAARSGQVPGTHQGTSNLFHKLVREHADIGGEHPVFLSRSYKYKAAADYLGEHYPGQGDLPDILDRAAALLAAVEAALRPPAP